MTKSVTNQNPPALDLAQQIVRKLYDMGIIVHDMSVAEESVRGCLAPLLQEIGWQSIATAPKDRITILGYTPDALILMGDVFFDADLEEWRRLPDERVRPTHWKPLNSPSAALWVEPSQENQVQKEQEQVSRVEPSSPVRGTGSTAPLSPGDAAVAQYTTGIEILPCGAHGRKWCEMCFPTSSAVPRTPSPPTCLCGSERDVLQNPWSGCPLHGVAPRTPPPPFTVDWNLSPFENQQRLDRLNREIAAGQVAPLPTAKEQHLLDVYAALGVKWGDDPFTAIEKLKNKAPGVAVSALRELIFNWQSKGAHLDKVHATMGTGYKVCAEHLAALCAAAVGEP